MKQKLLYKREEESPEFLTAKTKALAMKDHLTKAAGFLTAWLEGAKAMQKASKQMAESLGAGEDEELEAIARQISDGLADTQHGAGLVEVALDSVVRKIGWLNDLKKKCDILTTHHLELSRAKRKLADNHDPSKTDHYQAEVDRCQQTYHTLETELYISFKFILKEAAKFSPPGAEPSPLGLLSDELGAFKASQVSFYKGCFEVTQRFKPMPAIDVANIWTDFMERKNREFASSSESPLHQSGRDLFRAGMNSSSERQSLGSQRSTRAPPPPPPPPPPPVAVALNKYRALYDYTAQAPDELSFYAGSTLIVLDQDDENWWNAEDEEGNRGSIPSNYVEKV